MLPYLPPHLFGGEDFGNEYLHGLDFTVELDFGLEFSGAYNADYFACDIEYDCMTVNCLRGDVDTPAKSLSRKKERSNRKYRILSVKKSCWYVNYLRPGETRELTHDIASSDRFGEFRAWFRMPLNQGEN